MCHFTIAMSLPGQLTGFLTEQSFDFVYKCSMLITLVYFHTCKQRKYFKSNMLILLFPFQPRLIHMYV